MLIINYKFSLFVSFSSLLWHVSLYSLLSPFSSDSESLVCAVHTNDCFQLNSRYVLVFCVGDGKPLQHTVEVMEIAIDQFGSPNDRRLAIIDKNRDLFLAGVRLYGSQRKFVKLATMVRLLLDNNTVVVD